MLVERADAEHCEGGATVERSDDGARFGFDDGEGEIGTNWVGEFLDRRAGDESAAERRVRIGRPLGRERCEVGTDIEFGDDVLRVGLGRHQDLADAGETARLGTGVEPGGHLGVGRGQLGECVDGNEVVDEQIARGLLERSEFRHRLVRVLRGRSVMAGGGLDTGLADRAA